MTKVVRGKVGVVVPVLVVLLGVPLGGCAGGAGPADPQAPPREPAAEAQAPPDGPDVPGLRLDGDPGEPLVVRPVPEPVVAPDFFQAAVDAGTRSRDGSPGPNYWRNRARYSIEATLDPQEGRLTGRETIVYENRSPDALPVLVLHLHQNLHAEGVARGEPQEVTGGVEIQAVRVRGGDVPDVSGAGGAGRPLYAVEGQLMSIGLDRAVQPGESVELEIEWSTVLPQTGAGRIGWSGRELYYVGYWFPRMAVYDDLRGWDAEPYLGGAEFYDGFADYDVRLTVPGGWSVMATGELRNAGQVYRPEVVRRIDAASRADTVVRVVTLDDRLQDRVTVDAVDDRLTYHFQADTVRDFAFTASNVQRWDATSAVVPDRDGDGADDRVLIHAFWRENRAPLWSDQALYAKHAIEFHSRFTGLAYPWPHMTSVEGDEIIGGGMEFPMMTVIGAYRGQNAQALYNVTSHELAHMWIPMIVSTNEKRYAWMDEGSTTFLENQSRPDYWPDVDADAVDREGYLSVARAGAEQPMMRHGDYYEPGPGYGTASYPKPATLLVALRSLLGDETFQRAYRTFIDEWAWKHPTPWDFFNTFERFAGRDLDWWWTSFYFETWTLDHAVTGVETSADGRSVVVVEDRGWAVAPATVRVETTGAGTLELEVAVEAWLRGRTRVELPLPEGAGEVRSVTVDPDAAMPDVDRSNNVWEAGG